MATRMSNIDVLMAWLEGRSAAGRNLSSDGRVLKSFQTPIATRHRIDDGSIRVELLATAPSVTTARHIRLVQVIVREVHTVEHLDAEANNTPRPTTTVGAPPEPVATRF